MARLPINRIKCSIKFTVLACLNLYFSLWSRLYLWRWRPKIIIITGSVGKTSLLYMLKEQLAERALYSYRANTKIGISLNMLQLQPITSASERWRWLPLILATPWKALTLSPHPEKIYLVEYDAADPYASVHFKWWLRPDICLWTTVSRSHLECFASKAKRTGRESFDLIVSEFAALAMSASERIFAPADNKFMKRALKGARTPVTWVQDDLSSWQPGIEETVFKFARRQFVFSQPAPREFSQNLVLLQALMDHLKIKVKADWRDWEMPPGRCRFLKGYGGTLLLDSSYNAQPQAFWAMLEVLEELPIKKNKKWLVAADMIELGDFTQAIHEELAVKVLKLNIERVFLIGRRIKQYSYPILKSKFDNLYCVEKIDEDCVEFFKSQIKGGEVILFKGAAYLDILVEALLADRDDDRFLNRPGRLQQMLKKRK